MAQDRIYDFPECSYAAINGPQTITVVNAAANLNGVWIRHLHITGSFGGNSHYVRAGAQDILNYTSLGTASPYPFSDIIEDFFIPAGVDFIISCTSNATARVFYKVV